MFILLIFGKCLLFSGNTCYNFMCILLLKTKNICSTPLFCSLNFLRVARQHSQPKFLHINFYGFFFLVFSSHMPPPWFFVSVKTICRLVCECFFFYLEMEILFMRLFTKLHFRIQYCCLPPLCCFCSFFPFYFLCVDVIYFFFLRIVV